MTDEDEHQNKSDPGRIEELQKAINTLKAKKAALPPFRTRNERAIHGKLLKEIADKVEEYELLLEADRVAAVAIKHESEHKYYIEECLICWDEVRVFDIDAVAHFLCCGGCTCLGCFKKSKKLKTCPLCRADFPEPGAQENEFRMKCAERGVGWAQHQVALGYFNGRDGSIIDEKKAIMWFKKAAKQGYPIANRAMGTFYFQGVGVPQSNSKAFPYFKNGAALGDPCCQQMLGIMYYSGQGVEKDALKAVRYFTLTYNQGQQQKSILSTCSSFEKSLDIVCNTLGLAYYEGTGCKQSFVRAKYYLEEVLKKHQASSRTYYYLAMTLIKLAHEQFEGLDIPGYSTVPRTIHLMRQAANLGYDDAKEMLHDMEKHYKSTCAHCRRKASQVGEKLKRCNRCRASWYCGRACQLEYWKLGHKTDCVEEPHGCSSSKN